MDLNLKQKKVYESIDILSQEMAKFIVNSNKPKLISEIENDIINSEKYQNIKQNNSAIMYFSSESSELQKINMSKNSIEKNNNSNNSINSKMSNLTVKNHNTNNKDKIDINTTKRDKSMTNLISIKDRNNLELSSIKKDKKVSFMIDSKKRRSVSNGNGNDNDNDNSNFITDINTDIINNKNDKNKNNQRKNKNTIEITVSPIYGTKREDREIDYYSIKAYMDKKNKNNLLSQGTDNNNIHIDLKDTFGAVNDNNSKKGLNSSKNLYYKKEGVDNSVKKSYTQRKIDGLRKYNDKNYEREKKRLKTIIEDKILDLESELKKQNDNNNNNNNVSKKDDLNEYIEIIDKESIENINEDIEKKNNVEIDSDINTSSNNINDNNNINNNDNNNIINNDNNNDNNNNLENSILVLNYSIKKESVKYKDFLEKQLKRRKITESKVKKMKKEKELKEYSNYYSSPKINTISLQIVQNKGKYIPLFKRAIELENEKKMKILINQKLKNNDFIINHSNYTKRTKKQINDFFCAQMDWKEKIEKKNNNMKNKLKEKNDKNIHEIENYELKINPKSELIIMKKRKKNSLTIDDTSENSNTIITNSANRLYKDYEMRERKLTRLKKELTPSFRPTINRVPLPFYPKNKRKNKIMNTNQQIKEINLDKYKDNSYNYKYQSNNLGIIFRNNTLISNKSQKSRNPKGIYKYQTSSRPYNKKDNYLSSTAVESKNTKSIQKFSSDNNNTKLEKINENYLSNEEKSRSHISKSNIENNNEHSKINSISRDSKNNQKSHISKNTKSKVSNENSNSNSKDSNKYNSNSNSNSNSHSITSSKKNKTNSSKNNSKQVLEEKTSMKKLIISDNNSFNNSKNYSKNNTNKNNSKNNKTNNSINNEQNHNHNNQKKDSEKEKDENIQKTLNITNQQKEGKKSLNSNTTRRIVRANGSLSMSTRIKNTRNNKKSINNNLLFIKNNIGKIHEKNFFSRHRSVITKKSSDLLITNQYKDQLNPNHENSNLNLDDNIDINNIDKDNYNYFNDFFGRESKLSKNSKDIIKNNSYNLVDDILPSKKESFFDDNIDKENEQKKKKNKKKKIEKKLIRNYNLDSSDDKDIEENEDVDEGEEKYNKNEDQSFSWIKKLYEISNNGIKTERGKNEIKKKKGAGASTTRSQTKRKDTDREKDIINNNNYLDEEKDKLYRLNLRNSSSTGILNPYTFTANDGLFYKFFLKKK